MKKIVCLIMALCLCICTAAETYRVNTQFRTADIRIEDEWFSASSYEYNHDLMRAMLEISMTGWGSSDNYGLEGDFDRERYSRAAAEGLGLQSFRAYNYDKSLNDSSDYSAFYMGWRELEDGSCILMCVARCWDYGCGFANNFDVGDGGVHNGFYGAGSKMAEAIKDYALSELSGKDIKIVVTGYSRAAAVANIAAKLLDDMAFTGIIPCMPQDIFTYAFAVPMTVKSGREGESNALYDNIFSIINYLDIVPEVPLTVWEYTRYGRTLVFAKGEAPEAAKEMYSALCGRELDIAGKRDRIEKTLVSMAKQVPSTENYVSVWQDLFKSYLCATYGKVSAASIEAELIDRIRKQYASTVWGKYILDAYDTVGSGWISDPVLAVLMFEGEKGLDAIKNVAPAAALTRGTGDTVYASLLSYLACGNISAQNAAANSNSSALLLNAKYLPMLTTFAGFMQCFEGHGYQYYMAYLLSLNEEEAYS